MIDENAFGLWVSYFSIEDDEYALEREQFVERFSAFRALVRRHASERTLGTGVTALDFGHAIYFELAEGDETESVIQWLRDVRARLAEEGFASVAVLSHGGRWVDASGARRVEAEPLESMSWWTCSGPSEPLRRALYADAATRKDGAREAEGWGPGLYLDTEAIEALGKTPKNEPTVLDASGATFYRAGS